jgi:hypothetical protein
LVFKSFDGGLSGASLERPALQALLDQVRARKIAIIVVYKVDRLTRSLADFAKLVEIFDNHGVSFVSVTQSFKLCRQGGSLHASGPTRGVPCGGGFREGARTYRRQPVVIQLFSEWYAFGLRCRQRRRGAFGLLGPVG